ncbi:RNA polymerase sigma factor [Rathayibacter festucae]|uniref:RNA polymerase sigma factor n=1 Tax=Rathayibacter festucae TaxID=110937 RepID=UPI002A6B4A27|nr:sigma-70 family RNA polymerase sigma factor [Rathayibacter festucae]MDY0912318.1 sigma-70 family RNA polymerase sigma factor [Rathayibacter festucae]
MSDGSAAEDDVVLLDDLAGGSREAFGVLYRRHALAVYRYAVARLRSEEDAEDVLQSVFFALWKKRASTHFVGTSALPWLLVATRLECNNVLRAAIRQVAREQPDAYVGTAFSAERLVEARLVLEDVTRAVSRLPEIDQQIFRLCLVEDMTYADAAAQLDVQVGSVRNRLSRLRRLLVSRVEVG